MKQGPIIEDYEKLFTAIRNFTMLQRAIYNEQGQPDFRNEDINYMYSEMNKFYKSAMMYTFDPKVYGRLTEIAKKFDITVPSAEHASSQSYQSPISRSRSTDPLENFLNARTKQDFAKMSPDEKSRVLVDNRRDREFMLLLDEKLKQEPNFIVDIANQSSSAAKAILSSRIGYKLSDEQVANVLVKHRDSIVHWTGKTDQVSLLNYFKDIENLLSLTNRSLKQLLDNPAAKSTLLSTGRFQFFAKIVETKQAEDSKPTEPKAHREAWDPSLQSQIFHEDQKNKQIIRQIQRDIELGIDYYEILGLKPEEATESNINKRAKLGKAKAARDNDGEAMSRIDQAAVVLKDPSLKAIYDSNRNPSSKPTGRSKVGR